ncbi:MAG: ThuA domain-containing protein [Acidobacteria bacterium]|nr:ThuA domain-containing protein [Acidobacteriota bacterium]
MFRWVFVLGLGVWGAGPAEGARRVLHVIHSAGFRHDSVLTSVRAIEDIARRTGALEIVATEDLSRLTASVLRDFDAVFFFTSGELVLSDQQKRDLLDFVRQGKGFGGAHSATDTLYTWPEYGEMIGGYFDGHPWAQEAGMDIEDPDFPGLRDLAPGWRIVEEFYQFRSWSRDRVRVLMTLDTSTVDLKAEGVNRTDGDFALAWIRNYGQGRVFYTALGHFEDTWLDARFQKMLENALLWLVGEKEADASPGGSTPQPNAVSTVAGPAEGHAPGSIIAVLGERLTSGSSLEASRTPWPSKLAGTRVEVNGRPIPLSSVAPLEVRAQLPFDLTPGTTADLRVWSATRSSEPVPMRVVEASPVLVSGAVTGNVLLLYATGLGVVPGAVAGVAPPSGSAMRTSTIPELRVNGAGAEVTFCGLAPTLVGVYQINAALPAGAAGPPYDVQVQMQGATSNRLTVR